MNRKNGTFSSITIHRCYNRYRYFGEIGYFQNIRIFSNWVNFYSDFDIGGNCDKMEKSKWTCSRSIRRCFWREGHWSKGLTDSFPSKRPSSKTVTLWWLKQFGFGRVSFGTNNWRPRCADHGPNENIRICENIRLKITGFSIYGFHTIRSQSCW